jgi:hypothetical protein
MGMVDEVRPSPPPLFSFFKTLFTHPRHTSTTAQGSSIHLQLHHNNNSGTTTATTPTTTPTVVGTMAPPHDDDNTAATTGDNTWHTFVHL